MLGMHHFISPNQMVRDILVFNVPPHSQLMHNALKFSRILVYNTFYDYTSIIRGLMYDVFHQWIMDVFKLLYFNSRLISFSIVTSLIR